MADTRRFMRVWIRTLNHFERQLRIDVARARNAFIKSAAANYETSSGLSAHLAVAYRDRLRATLDTHYRLVIPHFAAMTVQQIKSRRKAATTQTDFQDLMTGWVSREALRKAKMIADTDRADILDAIDSGVQSGLGVAEISRDIRKVSSLTPFRAALISRTETHAAATYASNESARTMENALGMKLLKVWLPTLDDRTRPEHAAMASYPAIPLDEMFNVGGEMMDRPGDSSASPDMTINCRCAMSYEEAST